MSVSTNSSVAVAPNEPVILDSGAAARSVAASLGLGLCHSLPKAGDQQVVVVVSELAEVEALIEVEDRSWMGCAIAWQLPESALLRLHELGVQVFVGIPSIAAVAQALEYPPDPDEVSAARRLAARLAMVEGLLGDAKPTRG